MRSNAAIGLACLHNLGGAYVALVPAAAGALATFSGRSFFAFVAALWVLVTTVRELLISGDQLVWPEQVTFGHADEPAMIAEECKAICIKS